MKKGIVSLSIAQSQERKQATPLQEDGEVTSSILERMEHLLHFLGMFRD